jgi:hypothetical protein
VPRELQGRHERVGWRAGVLSAGTQFTCFGSTKVQILIYGMGVTNALDGVLVCLAQVHPTFTGFTSTKVQILTLCAPGAAAQWDAVLARRHALQVLTLLALLVQKYGY